MMRSKIKYQKRINNEFIQQERGDDISRNNQYLLKHLLEIG
jgi:hypothetical protein